MNKTATESAIEFCRNSKAVVIADKAQVEYSALCAIAEAADSLNKRVIFTAATGSPVQIANDKLCEALIALAKLRS